ncbi:hypothetical protein [Azospirillum cavernae]|uniref:hypothetical protein n=1 Tax=Azospirillum cavernae TaxID=2320860 RepID=UPI001313E149|nr:hypothetical protein [Azospirillum cavernae]
MAMNSNGCINAPAFFEKKPYIRYWFWPVWGQRGRAAIGDQGAVCFVLILKQTPKTKVSFKSRRAKGNRRFACSDCLIMQAQLIQTDGYFDVS